MQSVREHGILASCLASIARPLRVMEEEGGKRQATDESRGQ